MPFKFNETQIPGVILVEAEKIFDRRGYFMEIYQKSAFRKGGIRSDFVQENISISKGKVLRGLHYQKVPKSQGKLVQCIKGKIYDVAVDIRRGSPSFGKWLGKYLSDSNRNMLYIPPGFAHGFLSTSNQAEVKYKTTEEYSPKYQAGIIWDDPDLSIEWPLNDEPVISERDGNLPTLEEAEINFHYREN